MFGKSKTTEALCSSVLRYTRSVTKPFPVQELSSAKQLKNSDFSDLAKIDPVLEHPVDMFRSWREEAQNHKAKGLDICCLATVSKSVHHR